MKTIDDKVDKIKIDTEFINCLEVYAHICESLGYIQYQKMVDYGFMNPYNDFIKKVIEHENKKNGKYNTEDKTGN